MALSRKMTMTVKAEEEGIGALFLEQPYIEHDYSAFERHVVVPADGETNVDLLANHTDQSPDIILVRCNKPCTLHNTTTGETYSIKSLLLIDGPFISGGGRLLLTEAVDNHQFDITTVRR